MSPFPLERILTWALGLAALLLGAAWVQARRLRLRNEALARLTEERARDLEAALREAEAASRAKGDFLAVMSHELRTPIHALLGMTDLLLASRLDPDQRESVRTVRRAGRALLGLFNDVLDFSRMEAGRLSLRSAPFDLEELVEELLDLQSLAAQEKGLELVLRWEAPPGLVLSGDADRLRQVLLNLLGNALKFTSEGHVLLRVAGHRVNPGGFRLRLEVRDTGPGIPLEKQADLFEAFTQADTSITRRYGGAGLGLAISRRLVEAMGGAIGLASEPGAGASFHVDLELPLAAPPEAEERDLEGFPVLLRVSQPALREALEGALARLGVDVRADGEGLSLGLLEESPDPSPAPKGGAARWVLLCPLHQARDPQALRKAGFAGLLRRPVLRRELRDLLRKAKAHPESDLFEGAGLEPVAPPEDRPSLRVLLAEDNPLHQQVALRMLRALGAQVEVAGDGAAALAAARGGGYDLLLVDGQMPELDGLGLLRALRSEGFEVPILAMTAHALPGEVQAFREAGADGFLAKPFGQEELAAALRALHRSPVQPVVDREGLLGEMRDSPGALRELVALYCLHAPGRMQALRRALGEGQAAEAREALHALAGSAAYLRAWPLTTLGRELEAVLAEGDLDAARRRLPELERCYRQVWEALERLAADLGPR